jgi:hypothetical protein
MNRMFSIWSAYCHLTMIADMELDSKGQGIYILVNNFKCSQKIIMKQRPHKDI